MAIFYNSVVTYDDPSTPYDGVATTYTYTGSITITILPNHNIFDGAHYTYSYIGHITIEINVNSPYVRGFTRIPTTSGITIRIVPNSSAVIRQYYKFADPVRVGGCVFCGTYLYNE